MKYQDLCIAIQEIAQNHGVNFVFFEDINLLNSEDVVYPALVCQLKNVELQDEYDRYTLVLTVAGKATKLVPHDSAIEIKSPPANIFYCMGLSTTNGSIVSTGASFRSYTSLSFVNGNVVIENDSDLNFTLSVHNYERPVLIWSSNPTENGWLGYNRYSVAPHERLNLNCHNSLLQVCELEAVAIGSVALKIITQMRQNVRQSSISYTTIHAIRAALGNMNGVQVESCNVQPFKYKFRDECEGVVAEIILDVYFESRCN